MRLRNLLPFSVRVELARLRRMPSWRRENRVRRRFLSAEGEVLRAIIVSPKRQITLAGTATAESENAGNTEGSQQRVHAWFGCRDCIHEVDGGRTRGVGVKGGGARRRHASARSEADRRTGWVGAVGEVRLAGKAEDRVAGDSEIYGGVGPEESVCMRRAAGAEQRERAERKNGSIECSHRWFGFPSQQRVRMGGRSLQSRHVSGLIPPVRLALVSLYRSTVTTA